MFVSMKPTLGLHEVSICSTGFTLLLVKTHKVVDEIFFLVHF